MARFMLSLAMAAIAHIAVAGWAISSEDQAGAEGGQNGVSLAVAHSDLAELAQAWSAAPATPLPPDQADALQGPSDQTAPVLPEETPHQWSSAAPGQPARPQPEQPYTREDQTVIETPQNNPVLQSVDLSISAPSPLNRAERLSRLAPDASRPGLVMPQTEQMPTLDQTIADPPVTAEAPQSSMVPRARPADLPRSPIPVEPAPTQTAPSTTAAVSRPTETYTPSAEAVGHATQSFATQVQTAIERTKYYPNRARARGQSGLVRLVLTIDQNGTLLHAQMRHSSGHASLDDAALDAVRRAAPFPALPDILRPGPITLSVPLRYTL